MTVVLGQHSLGTVQSWDSGLETVQSWDGGLGTVQPWESTVLGQ